MIAHVISCGGDRMHSGPVEECTEFMRTHATADRVVRDDGVLLAVCQSYDPIGVWRWGFDHPGAPVGSL